MNQKQRFYVYILECADKTLYTGSTTNLQRRMHQHNHSKAGAHYTKTRRPVYLKYYEVTSSLSSARHREAELKQLSRIEKLKLINEGLFDHDKMNL